MKAITIFCLFQTLVFSASAYKDPHWTKGKNSIVHLFEWKFQDVAHECERFLQQKGFGGVQVSPISENVIAPNRPWWERYQPMSYIIQSRSGNEAEFLDMTQRCNAVGVRVYVDVVLNHMTSEWYMPVGTAGSTANPGNKEYPAVPYRPVDFHDTCSVLNYGDADEIRKCEFLGLKDLDQSSPYVREKILEFLNKLIDLGIAGFHIDAAKFMDPVDLEYIYLNLKDLNTAFGFAAGSRPFIYQEVTELGNEAVSVYNYTHLGAVTEFRHSAQIGPIFRGFYKLANLLTNWGEAAGFVPSNDALIFVENQENQRGGGLGGTEVLTYKDTKQYKMAVAFMLAWPYGITRLMSGYYFENADQGPPADSDGNIITPGINADDTCSNGWACEHRWRQIYNMVGFKNAVAGTKVSFSTTNNDQQISFCRGNKGFAAFTNGGDIDGYQQTCLPAGVYCDIISGNLVDGSCTGKSIIVEEDGNAIIQLLSTDDDGVFATHINAAVQ